GRHALFLGPAARRHRVRGAAGLSVERHGKLDVVRRPVVRPGGTVLPARAAWLLSTEQGVNVLQINNVTKRFGNLVAVREVSLSVAKGELCAIIGPNGAGKTTFFNLISGFFPPASGSIAFDGRDITRLSTHERVTRGMARTFQITEIFPELTVFENVRVSAEVAGGYRLRPWITRSETAQINERV